MMAAAANTTIAEVEILVEPGELEADHVHSPGIYVQRIVKGAKFEKPIEQRTVRKRSA
jgi:3-oxoacid CoA-transferase subunit A